jgi:fatty-acyl-CoA synthase
MTDRGSATTLRPFYWRATRLFADTPLVSPDRRLDYGAFDDRVSALAAALDGLGVGRGGRVGTLAGNSLRHLETFFAVPLLGGRINPVNANLGGDGIAHVVRDAGNEVLFVDPGEPFRVVETRFEELESVELVVVLDDATPSTSLPEGRVVDYESLLAGAGDHPGWPDLPGDQPASICYTSGSTGEPKGAEYTQSMLHTYTLMSMTPAGSHVAQDDVVMPVVPMFHVNSWGLPYAATAAGAKQVYPGPDPTPARLAELVEAEGVTVTNGVPTVWIDFLEHVREHEVDLSSLERIVTGGFAVPEHLIEAYDDLGIDLEHTWGMTETMSLAAASRPKSPEQDWSVESALSVRAKQGLLAPGYEMQVLDEDDERVPWDGETPGELLIRGPTVIDEYHECPAATAREFEGEWLRTGDVVTVDEGGYVEIVDRKKDLINSGGEWISTIALENALMGHDEVVAAAVVPVDDERWGERPVAFVQARNGDVAPGALRDFLRDDHPRWWLPDDVVLVDEVPENTTGKFDKAGLREWASACERPWRPSD